MKYLATVYACLVLLFVAVAAQEKLVLQTPPAAPTEYRVQSLRLEWGDVSTCAVIVRLIPNVGGEVVNYRYDGAAACTMLQQLNKANLSTMSLQRRIIERLVTDKVLTGTVQGSPE